MSDYEVFEVPNVLLQRGGLLPMARLAYKTLGTLSPARDNAVLVPTWYTGTHNDIETFMVGEGRALDPRKYFIVMTNLLGNGLSSSPSNSPPPNERGRFPKVTIHDNVRLQQILAYSEAGPRAYPSRDRLVDGRVPDLRVGRAIPGHGARRVPNRRLGPNGVIQQGLPARVAARTRTGPGLRGRFL